MVGKVEESAKEVEQILNIVRSLLFSLPSSLRKAIADDCAKNAAAKAKGGTIDARTGMATEGTYLLTAKDSLHCSICGKDMIDPITGAAFIGMSFKISVDPNSVNCDSNLSFFKKQLGVYGCLLEKDSPALIDLCWECWFKGLGIIPR